MLSGSIAGEASKEKKWYKNNLASALNMTIRDEMLYDIGQFCPRTANLGGGAETVKMRVCRTSEGSDD